MAGQEANCHSMQVRGAGGTAAGTITNIGNITLPAGGPWNIFGLWGYSVMNAAAAADAIQGDIQVVSSSGDVNPQPAPARFPLAGIPSYLGAATGKPLVPVTIHNVVWQASGKAVLALNYINNAPVTNASQVALGLMFASKIPVPTPYPYCDRVTAQITAAGSTSIGTITLAEKAKRILGICATVLQDGVSTATQEILPYFTLTSDDLDLAPSQWPCDFASSIGLATNHGLNNAIAPKFIPVDMPILGGARIDCAIDLLAGVSNGAQATISIAYE